MKRSSHFNFPEVHSFIFVVVQSPSCVQLFATHGLQYTRLLCPSPSPGIAQVHVQWIGDAIQPSHPLLASSPLALNHWKASGSFPMSQVYASGGQSIGASASDLPKSIQDWLPLRLTDLIFLLSKGLSRVFSTTVQKYQSFSALLSLMSRFPIHSWLLERP